MKKLLLSILLLLSAGFLKAQHKEVLLIPVEINNVEFSCSKEYLDSIAKVSSEYFYLIKDNYPSEFKVAPIIKLPNLNVDNTNTETAAAEVLKKCVEILPMENYDKNMGFIFSGAQVWPHENTIGQSKYFVVSEFFEDDKLQSGIVCHEYGHILGLKDLYDTDADKSGGLCTALYSSLSLMDKGDRNNGQRTPAGLSAVELRDLGIGICDTLKEGHYRLNPISRDARYLFLPTDRIDEYFLIECRAEEAWDAYIGGSGLLVYHIDKSTNKAGYSNYYEKTLSAAQRWEYNEVNCRPDHPCAKLISATAEPQRTQEVFFGNGETLSCESDVELRAWSGKGSELALQNIVKQSDGSVEFDVIRPIARPIVHAFQQSAILSWELHESLVRQFDSCTVSLIRPSKESIQLKLKPISGQNCISACVDGLENNTVYEALILIYAYGEAFSLKSSFKTLPIDQRNTIPFIMVDKDSPTRFPLQVYNSHIAKEVRWTFNGVEIKVDDNGYFTATHNGILRAELIYEDGSSDIICKEVILR